jgi:hypothetical protein
MISADSPFASRPLDRRAFNMGFSLIDTGAWKSAKVTEKFEEWVKVSFEQLLFPPDTLGFGLGLGYFALADAVECYDDKITHLVGLAFVNDESLAAEGWTAKTMLEKSAALHYNGANKPWMESAPPCAEDGSIDLLSNPTSPLQIWQATCIHSKMCNWNCSHVPNYNQMPKALGGNVSVDNPPSSSRESHTLSHASEELQLETTNDVIIQDVSNDLKVADFSRHSLKDSSGTLGGNEEPAKDEEVSEKSKASTHVGSKGTMSVSNDSSSVRKNLRAVRQLNPNEDCEGEYTG